MQSFIKNTTRTLEDLRSFYQERADIEQEYSKRLSKLSKTALGRHETGPMRQALEKVRGETEAIARSHAQLVHSIRKEIENPLSDLMARTENVRRPAQVATTKLYKHKQMQMQYVQRAREKYEQDCTKINAYTAQSNLVQGKELDKLMNKLERVQATVGTNDKDYQSYVRALQDTTYKWNSEWKSFLDVCQDVEEERQEFLKTNLWSFENAISSVCVTDDEACERVRVSLEQCDAARDVEMFVREFGTGANIPAAPEYINYAQGQAPPADPNQSAAQFHRLSTRASDIMPPLSTGTPIPPSVATPSTAANATPNVGFTPNTLLTPNPNLDLGRSGSRGTARTPPPRQSLEPVARTPPPSTSNRNSMFSPGAPPIARMGSQSRPEPAASQPSPSQAVPGQPAYQPPSQPAYQPPSQPAYQPSSQPAYQPSSQPAYQPSQPAYQPSQPAPSQPAPNQPTYVPAAETHSRTSYASSAGPSTAGPSAAAADIDESDPIAKALANLRMHQSRKSPAPNSRPTSMVQPNTTPAQAAPAQAPPAAAPATMPGAMPGAPMHALASQPVAQPAAAPPPAEARSVDPRLQQRPLSPAAAFMNPPARGESPIPVEQVLTKYGQSFPSERRLSSHVNYEAAPAAGPARSTTPGGIALNAQGVVTQDQMAENYAPAAGSNAPPAAPGPRPPTGQYSEAGEPILFYVKALYDYAASMPEEFSFTAGDIIAVTHTEPDGWWQGELLDEARRVPGANTFPSNFVVLLM
ncbi:hypothetical protein CBS9595_000930 [Malassezia furfur]|nr:hypothetical protein CBS9595_000930 [Malassezia furfur]